MHDGGVLIGRACCDVRRVGASCGYSDFCRSVDFTAQEAFCGGNFGGAVWHGINSVLTGWIEMVG